MLEPGDVAPPFTATTHEGKEVRLSDFAGKRVLLWWYPAASTPG
jgi:peroxiredoxin Q/BCP